MESLIETFHIDIKLLVAQVINFAIVISVLYFFALKPLIKIMRDRTVKIEKSLEDAKKIDVKLDKTGREYREAIARAKKEASEILAKTREQAENKKQTIIGEAQTEIGRMVSNEKIKLQREKAKILKEVKADVAGLVVASVAKVLEKKVDDKEDKKLIKKLISK